MAFGLRFEWPYHTKARRKNISEKGEQLVEGSWDRNELGTFKGEKGSPCCWSKERYAKLEGRTWAEKKMTMRLERCAEARSFRTLRKQIFLLPFLCAHWVQFSVFFFFLTRLFVILLYSQSCSPIFWNTVLCFPPHYKSYACSYCKIWKILQHRFNHHGYLFFQLLSLTALIIKAVQ